jgi:hypothetical protein
MTNALLDHGFRWDDVLLDLCGDAGFSGDGVP